MEYTMSKITINETVFDGESVLRAVRQITPLPCVGMGGAWYGRQIVTQEELEARRQKILNEHWDALDRGEIQPGPCASPAEVMRGGWRFLYFADYYGNWNTECFTVCGRNAATEKGGTGNG